MTPAEDSTPDFEALAAEHDRHRMAAVLERSHRQIETALAVPMPKLPAGPFDEVVVAGLGGSALPVEVLADTLGHRLRAPLTACRTYRLPASRGRRLVIASSYSGNTEETLAAFAQALDDGESVVVLTRNGALAEAARERSLPLVIVPSDGEPPNFQPRSATGYFITLMARILAGVGAMDHAADELAAAARFLAGLDPKASALAAARWIGDRIPVVYTDDRHAGSLARVAKIKFNEHAKRPAFWNALPEANHNETIGLSNGPGRFALLYLHDPESPPEVLERYQAMERVFGRRELDHVAFHRHDLEGSSNLERVLYGLLWADWCAWAVALLDGRDPTPVELVEAFKAELVRARED